MRKQVSEQYNTLREAVDGCIEFLQYGLDAPPDLTLQHNIGQCIKLIEFLYSQAESPKNKFLRSFTGENNEQHTN